jgi:hypothetical protein
LAELPPPSSPLPPPADAAVGSSAAAAAAAHIGQQARAAGGAVRRPWPMAQESVAQARGAIRPVAQARLVPVAV